MFDFVCLFCSPLNESTETAGCSVESNTNVR